MTRIILMLTLLAMPLTALSQSENETDSSSTAFEAADGDTLEVFGSEGPILLVMAMVMLAAISAVSILGSRSQTRCSKALDEVEELIGEEEDDA